MRKYKQVPSWWYGCTFLAIFGISIAFLYVYDTGLPWYGLILAIALHVVLLLPTGIMMAYCNIKLSTAVISALMAGYIWPGKMMNNVVFKIFTLVSSAQGLGYISAMKLAHYMVSLFLQAGKNKVSSNGFRKSLPASPSRHSAPASLFLG